jgi:ATP phosphoribosyltransferase regulatory subunit
MCISELTRCHTEVLKGVQMMSKQLLHTPEGIRDIYGFEYKKKLAIQEKIRKSIKSFGYEAIQTPTFEYIEVFSKEIGTTASRNLYKLIDKDGETLALRPDFTPAVARCAAKYFLNEQKPLRLTYEGNTFVNTSHLQGKLKETTQMGAELIMDGSVEADAELLAMVVAALKATGLERFQISVGHTDYFKGLCEDAGLSFESENQLREAISEKNIFAARNILEQLDIKLASREALLEVADLFGAMQDLNYAKSFAQNSKSLAAIERLEQLKNLLEYYDISQYISFDLGLLSQYQYYTGIVFKAFTYGIGDAIVKGGRYDQLLAFFGKEAPAVGFMVIVDDILEALERQKIQIDVEESPLEIFYTEATYVEALKEAAKLRTAGQAVILTKER